MRAASTGGAFRYDLVWRSGYNRHRILSLRYMALRIRNGWEPNKLHQHLGIRHHITPYIMCIGWNTMLLGT